MSRVRSEGHSHSSQCSTTGVTKAKVCTILQPVLHYWCKAKVCTILQPVLHYWCKAKVCTILQPVLHHWCNKGQGMYYTPASVPPLVFQRPRFVLYSSQCSTTGVTKAKVCTILQPVFHHWCSKGQGLYYTPANAPPLV